MAQQVCNNGRKKTAKSTRHPHGNSKLTPALMEAICEGLRQGMTIGSAAEACGVHRTTIHAWIARGEQNPGSIYATFADRLTRARAQGERELLKIIWDSAEASPKGWRAAAWLLTHTFGQHYGNAANRMADPEIQGATIAHEGYKRDDTGSDTGEDPDKDVAALIRQDPEAVRLAQELAIRVQDLSRGNGDAPAG